MHSGPFGYSDPSIPFKNDPQQPPALTPRFPSNLTGAAPAKRITFFKSGDSQFGGVRMAIHSRSFKCFDALLDDLSQKVPLPFGVRTITTPRGTHNIKRLEQLEDGGCYLCSDRRHVKPINMEVAGKRPVVWHHHSRPHSGRRRPIRPEEAPPEHVSPHYYRHPKRIVLMKNTDPSVRRSIILSRRTARSLRVFMEEVSELMQCHIKKLYTIEGRKIDSIQSLMHCPNVLVCVGREPFRPLMLECRKNSEEKLPGMSARSRSSLCSEGHESKKNVNFGLETKKSIIHPRSDSSNRSTRFSLSSEKSYPNGLCTPGQSGYVTNCPHAKETLINDDIEKRVLVNKDGSLSVEMKVRFRLTNDETLQWSTEIKKSPGVTNEAIHEKEANPHYLQQGKEFSEQESCGEVEDTFTAKFHQRQIEKSHCENCCNHCQEYDIWKNPMHREHHRSSRHVKSSSSSTSSHKIVRKEASVDSIRTISRSSEEYTEHVVEKASCYQQTVEGGDTMVEYCTISRCCSRSEATTSKSKRSHAERCEGETQMLQNGERRPDTSERRHRHSCVCCVEVTKASDTEDRPVSAISNSSKVLESLKEDQDDDDDDLPPSASRTSLCSQGEQENEECSREKTDIKTPDQRLLSPKRSEFSGCSLRSSKHKVKNDSITSADQQHPIPNGRSKSRASTNSLKCRSVSHCGAAIPKSAASNGQVNEEDGDRPESTVSKSSKASRESHKFYKVTLHSPRFAASNGQPSQDKGEEEITQSAMSGVSGGSAKCGVCPHCGGCDRESESASRPTEELVDQVEDNQVNGGIEEKPPSVMSTKSAKSTASEKSGKSTKCENHETPRGATHTLDIAGAEPNGGEEAVPCDRVESAQSNHSKVSSVSRKSNRSVCSNCQRSSVAESVAVEEKSGSGSSGKDLEEEDRVGSSLSNISRMSHKSNCSSSKRATSSRSPAPNVIKQAGSNSSVALERQETEEAIAERSARAMSSSKQTSMEEKLCIDDGGEIIDERATSALSYKTDTSIKTHRSHRSNCSASKRAKSPSAWSPSETGVTNSEEETEKRADSAVSVRSNISAASRRSVRPESKASGRGGSQASAVSEICQQEPEADEEVRAASVLSNKSKASNRSNFTPKPSCSDEDPLPAEDKKKPTVEPEEGCKAHSMMSNDSDRSRASQKSSCSTSSKAKSPRAAMPAKVIDLNANALEAEENAYDPEPETTAVERPVSVMSNKTDASLKYKISEKLVLVDLERSKSPRPKSPAKVKQAVKDEAEKRPNSSLSVKSDISSTPRRSKRAASPAKPCEDDANSAPEERSTSAMSKKSTKSSAKTVEEAAKSHTKESKQSPCRATAQPGRNVEVTSEERPTSAMSKKSTKSSKNQTKEENEVQERGLSKATTSIKSSKSQKASHNVEVHSDDTVKVKEVKDQRPESVMSHSSEKTSLKCSPELASTPTELTDTPAGQEVGQAIEEVIKRSKSALSMASYSSKKSARSPSPRPKSSQSKTGKVEEEPRASSTLSVNSKVSSESGKCRCSHLTPDSPESKTMAANAEPENTDKPSVPDVIATKPNEGFTSEVIPNTEATEEKKAESVKSVKSSTKSKVGGLKKETENRSPSALSTSSAKVIHSKSPAFPKAEEQSVNSETENTAADKEENDSGNENTAKDSRPKSSASVRSDMSTKMYKVTKINDMSQQASYLDVKVPINDLDGTSENGSVKSFKSTKKAKSVKFDKTPEKDQTVEVNSRTDSGSMSNASQKCLSPAKKQPNQNKPPTIRLASTSSDSVLSNAFSAADLLRELSGNTRPSSRVSQRKVVKEKENDKPETNSNKSSKETQIKRSSSERDNQSLELVQSCLPNTSPNDVVNEWLKNIPVDVSMYQMEDELDEPKDLPQEETFVNTVQNESEEAEEETEENVVYSSVLEEKNKEPEMDAPAKCHTADVSLTDIPKANSNSPKIEYFPKRSHSSVQVMKALLSPQIGRCNSLPEVSPVYGRKLSKSAKGLLDCLAKLRLIDSDPTGTKNAKYSEIMNILQTLWLYEPTEWDQEGKDRPSGETEANPRSSSGVDVNSGSDNSTKSMINGREDKFASATPTLIVEQLSDSEGHKEEAVSIEDADEETSAQDASQEGGNEGNYPGPAAEGTAKIEQDKIEEDKTEDVSDSATPDVAARIKGSPDENSDEAVAENDPDNDPVKEEKSAEIPKANVEMVPSITDSSGKDSRSANGTESDRPGDSSSSTPPSVQRAQLTRKVSQDPDPVWVLSLLKKIEKQFMTHYATAMAEFKVRWDLDDNVMLDTMINELKVEVHKRIQESIKRELQKIQGRAGRPPRPPMAALSKESSVQTDQRRRRLKVMRKQSLMPSKSEDSDVASGTDNSDLRSEDEYCPCDACMRKKLEARQMLKAEVMNSAPVMMDFDLRKILQIKKDPAPTPKVELPPAEPPKCQPDTEASVNEEEGANLDVVLEEPEQEEEVPEEVNAEEEPNEENEVDAEEKKAEGEEGEADGGAVDGTVTAGAENEVEAEKTNNNLEKGDEEQTAEAEIVKEETEEDGEDNKWEGDDETVAVDSSVEQDAANHQLSKDGTEDEAIAEKTPLDDTDIDGNKDDSTEAVDEIEEDRPDEEIQNVFNEDAPDTIKSDTVAEEVSEGPLDVDEEVEDKSGKDTRVVNIKAVKEDSWEQFRNRQMTRTSVESQPGSLDSVELEQEAKQIVQSVFSSISAHKIDRDETDEGLKMTSKKRSRSPARANKSRRPKDGDIKVDDLEF